MPITSAAGFVDAVRRFGLLAPPQADELVGLQPRFADARALAKELLQRGWLTPYQINHLVAGNGCNLVLGQYVLLERIGEGGMGQVLKARHQRLERIVALKLIRKERLGGRDAVQRFQREARAAARLSHPNLVTVYDADEVGGTHFFAMEYVEGTDLAKLVRQQGPLPARQACDYIRQAALGLQHAHEQGLVHRDIKPANLMLTTKGVVKVLDLGLARLANAPESEATDPMTREGTVMGTPDYMAPEQAKAAHTADIRADLYSLGCTLFYLLSAKVPYPGGTLTEKLVKHQLNPLPRVERLRREVPPDLAAVVRRLMAKTPAERYATPADLAAALEPFCGTRPPVATPVGETVAFQPDDQSHQNTNTEALTEGGAKPVAIPVATVAFPVKRAWWREGLSAGRRLAAAAWPPLARAGKRRPWLAAGAGALAALLLLGLIVRLVSHRSEDGQPGQPPPFDPNPLAGMKRDPIPYQEHFEPLPPEVQGWLGDLWGRHWGAVRCAAYGPEGSGLAASGGDDKLIRLWDGKTLEPRGILKGHAFPVTAVAFSPDGKKLASCSEGDDRHIWLWNLEKKTNVKLEGHENNVTLLGFSKDGRYLLSAGREQVVHQWNLATGRSRRLVLAPGVRCVALSPNGRHVLSGQMDKTLRLWDVEKGGEVRRFEGHTEVIDMAAFSPDGSRAVSASTVDNSVRLWDVESGKELRRATRPNMGGDSYGLTFSPSGRRVAVNQGYGVYHLDAETLAQIGSGSSVYAASLAYSPDSQRVLIVSGGVGQTILRLWDLETGVEVRRPYGHARAVSSVAFTPDGRYLLSGSLDGNATLWSLESRTSGGGYPHVNPVNSLAISSDGRYALAGVAAHAGNNTTLRLWEIEPQRLGVSFDPYFNGMATSVALSPDGRLALSGGWPAPELRLWDLEKRVEARAFEGVNEVINCVTFSPDGTQAASGGALKIVRLWDVTTGKEIRSLSGHADAVTSVAYAPDGRHLLSGSSDATVRLWVLQEDQPKGRVLEGSPRAAITCVAFAPDGKTFAASGQDGRITLWSAATEKPLWQTQLPGAVLGLAYAGDSRHLATANANGTVFILRLPDAESSGGK